MDSKIKYGLIAGVGTVALFLLFYLSEPAWMLSPYLWWGSLVIYIWAMAKAIKPAAKIEIKLGLREGFVVYAIANAIVVKAVTSGTGFGNNLVFLCLMLGITNF